MLSVLSTGTMALSEQLAHERHEVQRLRGSNHRLLGALDRRKGAAVRSVTSSVQRLALMREQLLKRTALNAFKCCLMPSVMLERMGNTIQSQMAVAWRWWWARRMLSRWRRAACASRFANQEERHTQVADSGRRESERLRAQVWDLESRVRDLEAVLLGERRRASGLEETVEQLTGQVSDSQAALKGCYVRQFEEAQKSERLEHECARLTKDLEWAHKEVDGLRQQVSRNLSELSRQEAARAEQDARLREAAGELCLAEDVIDDLTSSKCSGLRRFFEKYNLPKVLVLLFRRVVELQGQLRDRGSLGGAGGAPTASPAAVEAEVRQHLSLSRDGLVSRHALQVYVESLHLPQVSSGMVTQVVLALLDLDLGDRGCESGRFASLLQCPPAWEDLEFATALWGAVGEPASAILEQRRRTMARATQQACASARRASPPAALGRLRASGPRPATAAAFGATKGVPGGAPAG